MINAFSRFQALLPRSTTSVVTITSINTAAGTSNATTLAGQTITIIGTSVAVGQRAFIQNGEIIRPAPMLSITELSI